MDSMEPVSPEQNEVISETYERVHLVDYPEKESKIYLHFRELLDASEYDISVVKAIVESSYWCDLYAEVTISNGYRAVTLDTIEHVTAVRSILEKVEAAYAAAKEEQSAEEESKVSGVSE